MSVRWVRALSVLLLCTLGVGTVWMVQLFEDERRLALAAVDDDEARAQYDVQAALRAVLRDESDQLVVFERWSQAAVHPQLSSLLWHDGARWVWPPASPPPKTQGLYRRTYDEQTSNSTLRQERRLLVQLLQSAPDDDVAHQTWLAFVAHRQSHQLHPAVELRTLLDAADVVSSRQMSQGWLLDDKAVVLAGAPGSPHAPDGLFALSLQALHHAPEDIVVDVTQRVRNIAQRWRLPTKAWLERMQEPALDKAPAVDPQVQGCQLVPHDDDWVLGCKRGASWWGRRTSLSTLLAAARQRLPTSAATREVKWTPTPGLAFPSADEALVVDDSWQTRRSQAQQRFAAKVSLLGVLIAVTLGLLGMWQRVRQAHESWMRAKEELLSTVTHELKTPVASIRLLGETLQRKLKDDGVAKDYPARIVREADRMQHLTENLLSYQRMHRGRWQLVLDTIDPRDVVDDVLEDLHALDAHARVQVDIGDEVQDVDVDRELLHLALRNLVKNALHHSPDADDVQVKVTQNATDTWWVVDDNGPGVPVAHQEQLFEAFVRGSASTSGTGLGLALARTALRIHGGDAVLQQTSSKGSTFALQLPRDVDATGETEST